MNACYVAGRLRVVVAVGLVLMGLTWVGTAGASTGRCQSWGSQPPDEGSSTNQLDGVAMTSACNAWAVGSFYNGTADQTLIEHWSGTAWRIQTSPNPDGSTNENELYGVTATSSTNAWAVGSYSNGTTYKTLVEHWNGKSWKAQPSPSPSRSNDFSRLDGVTAVSPTDAWAVGVYYNGTEDKTLVEHWNGKSWKVQPSPTPGRPGRTNGRFLRAGPQLELTGVAASSPNDAWAVGFHWTRTTEKTLVEHWNGKAWKVQPSPNPGGFENNHQLDAVATTSSKDAWAVGYNGNVALVEHWNGKAWKVQYSPNPGPPGSESELDGVSAASSKNAWAVGDDGNNALIEHWDGKAWKVQPSPNLGPAFLDGIAAGSAGDAWAVGEYQPGNTEKAFAVHCC